MSEPTVSPIRLEIMRNRWRGIAEEVCAAMIRASYSPNIRDRFDCSTALALPSGEIIAQAEIGTPLHLGNMPGVINSVLARIPLRDFAEGDAVITNLPYPEGPGHLPDVSMVSAVFHEGRPVLLVVTTSHHVDMGGYAPGSMPFGVTEIYQEGLQIPPVKLFARGVMDQGLYDLIQQNVRTQRELRGDLMAQWAAACTATARVHELYRTATPAEIARDLHAILDHAEASMRAGLRRLRPGTYEFEDFLDDDGAGGDPVRIRVKLTVADGRLEADFAGTSPQVAGPLNARITAARACVYYAVKAVVDPDLPSCAGAQRPITVRAEEGTLLQARFPAAIGNANILTDQRVVDVLFGALYQCAPDRVCAACSSEMNLTNIGGVNPATGDYFNFVETYGGGIGACHDLDGEDGIQNHLTNTQNTPVEVVERNYPLRVTRYGLVPDSGGAGRHRGGCGLVREFLFLGERAIMTLSSDRRRFTPWGLDGGGPARGAHTYLTGADGRERELPTKTVVTLARGDRIRIETPGGGGWGPAAERPAAAVASDLRNGYISPAFAAAHYGAAR
ncbi:MAG: hydantoinase B/oxoprolinase family protein [Opitutaceae bacterium]|nr:hydantoinase B/oxoprolinase family protein [Opitutaceae bacterium]